jgi:O-methyltransferase domain/Dimerisation domain
MGLCEDRAVLSHEDAQETAALRGELLELLGGFMRTQALAVAAQLGIADVVGDGPTPVDELAGRTGAHAPSLYRLLRLLASLGVFEETAPRQFGPTRLSDALRSDTPHSLRYLALAFAGPAYRAWAEAAQSFRTGLPTFDHVFGTPFFDYLSEHPEDAENFDRAMAGGARARAAAVADYDWGDVATVVDVGGGTGSLLASILDGNRELQGVVFDLPHVADKATAAFEAAGLAGRARAVGGNFFTDQLPAADAYVLGHILHDWSDDQSLQILRNVRRSIPDHGRLLVLENLVPEGNDKAWVKQLDLHMLVMLGGKERTESEWRDLLAAGGFTLVGVASSPAADLLEARPRPS